MTGIALIQGSSRGLGLQFCKHILSSKTGCNVIATCRDPSSAEHLHQLQMQYKQRLDVLKLDVTNESDIRTAAEIVTDKHKKLDLLINCTGQLHPSGRGETSLADVTSQGLLDTFSTNTIGPLLVAKHFSPLLLKGDGYFSPDKNRVAAALVNISAKVGSITDNGLGGWYSYRMSKAALNMATKNLSIELGRRKRKLVCLTLHPGTVDTDLSRPYHKSVPDGKLFTTEHSVQKMWAIIEVATHEQSGQFYNWDGTQLPF